MYIADAATLILFVSWLVGLTPGWLIFVPLAIAITADIIREADNEPPPRR